MYNVVELPTVCFVFSYDHLDAVYVGRTLYNSTIDEAKAEVKRLSITELGRHDDVQIAYYSFDYAQIIHLTSDPMQVRSLFFLCPRKVGIFGVCAEATPCQVILLHYSISH